VEAAIGERHDLVSIPVSCPAAEGNRKTLVRQSSWF
jgi:hypothetical protein